MADLKKEILKKLDRFQYSRGRREVFLDAVEHMALTIAIKFDPLKQEERSDRIAEILSNYKGQDGALFFMLQTDMLALIQEVHVHAVAKSSMNPREHRRETDTPIRLT